MNLAQPPTVVKPTSVIKAFDYWGQMNKRPRQMDDIFKALYVDSMFSIIGVIPNQQKQVSTLAEIWTHAPKSVNRTTIRRQFYEMCGELSLPAESYNFEQAYKQTTAEWSIELMLAVLEMIIKWDDHDVPYDATNIAVWDVVKQTIVVDKSWCKKF